MEQFVIKYYDISLNFKTEILKICEKIKKSQI